MRSRLFSRCAGTSFSRDFNARARSHDIRCIKPLILETIGLIRISGSGLWVFY